ncbi:MAG: hypothetical protein CM1200mP32_06510 [Methanobacteriota archaeon]|nr:MAG: hypothetical protein CM1200mP32_06510 [Euryarchaeota archaeon]
MGQKGLGKGGFGLTQPGSSSLGLGKPFRVPKVMLAVWDREQAGLPVTIEALRTHCARGGGK